MATRAVKFAGFFSHALCFYWRTLALLVRFSLSRILAHIEQNRQPMAFAGHSFVVVGHGGVGIERQIKLILPAKFETRFAHGVITNLRSLQCPLAKSAAWAVL